MDHLRGILMIGLGAFVLYRGFLSRWEPHPAFFILGLLSIAVGIWRLTRMPPRYRR